jgi:serpin B
MLKHFFVVLFFIYSVQFFAEEEDSEKIDGNHYFAVSLYSEIKGESGNIAVSPFNISRVMSMLYMGSAGATAQEISEAMFFSGRAVDFTVPQSVYMADSMWVQQGLPILPSYSELFDEETVYSANFLSEPDNAREEINLWVEDNTEGKINKLFKSGDISSSTRLVLASAIYFKADWLHKFNSTYSHEELFYPAQNNKIMMYQEANFPIYIGEDFDLLEMPYRDDDISMFVLLYHDLDAEPQISPSNIREWIENMESRQVAVTLPKFDIVNNRSLNDTLKGLGVERAFTTQADFSPITGSRDLFLNTVVHKAAITVDEDGTEAAAATGAVMNLTASFQHEPPIAFHANHSFIYFIMDKQTENILFLGRIEE